MLAAFVATDGDPAWTLAAGAAAIAGLVLVALLPPGRSEPGADGTASGEGLPVGTPAPGFRLPGLGGEVHTLDLLRARGLPVLLLFTDPNCGPCIELAPDVARWQRGHSDELVIAAIEHDRGGDHPQGADEHGRANVLLQRDGEVADLCRAQGTPTGVLVDSHGVVASPVAAGRAQIEALVARTVDEFEPRGSREAPTRPLLGTRLRRREVVVRGGRRLGGDERRPRLATACDGGRPPASPAAGG